MAKQSEATLLLRIKSAGDGILSKTKAALGDLRTWAAAAFAALTSGAAISAFKEAEESTNKLNQALIQQGIYTKSLSADYQKMAADLQGVTTYEDDAIKAAQAQMQGYLGQTKITRELMQATLDLAAAKKMDLGSAAEMVAKSIGTGTNALARQGVELDKNAPKGEKMDTIIRSLNERFGGQAEAAAKGLGSLTQMKNVVGDLLEVIGEQLAPFVIRGAQAISKFAQELQNSETFVVVFQGSLIALAQIAAAAKLQFVVLKDVLVAVFTSLYASLQALAAGDFRAALNAVTDGFSAMTKKIGEDWDEYNAELKAIDNIYAKERQSKQDEELRNLKATADRKKAISEGSAAEEEAFFKVRDDKEIAKLITHNRLKHDAHIASLNAIIEAEKGSTRGLEAELEKRKYLDKEYAKDEMSRAGVAHNFIKSLGIERVDLFMAMLDDLSEMQTSKNKLLVGVGKAAAIANIAINTANAATGAHAAMDSIPIIGPGLGTGAAISIIAFGAEKSAEVAGIQLAEGGIVKATPGGVRATIGEGGRDEAVIPLDSMAGMGTKINITVYGGFLGNEQDAREMFKTFDEGLFRLRQSNESMAFDKGFT